MPFSPSQMNPKLACEPILPKPACVWPSLIHHLAPGALSVWEEGEKFLPDPEERQFGLPPPPTSPSSKKRERERLREREKANSLVLICMCIKSPASVFVKQRGRTWSLWDGFRALPPCFWVLPPLPLAFAFSLRALISA